MSRTSKAKRDAQRRKQPAAFNHRAPVRLEPHAQLSVDGSVRAAVAQRDDAWLLVLDGRAAGSTDSPAMMMAMLRHIAAVREAAGGSVQLAYSQQLRGAATVEAQGHGLSLHAYLDQLEAERAQRHTSVTAADATAAQARADSSAAAAGPDAVGARDDNADAVTGGDTRPDIRAADAAGSAP